MHMAINPLFPSRGRRDVLDPGKRWDWSPLGTGVPKPIAPETYDLRTILLHWVTAVLVAEQWIGAQLIDYFPRGPLRIDARSVHILLGVLLGAVLVIRIAWRSTEGRRLPNADSGMLGLLAKLTHRGLYALVASMIAVGIFLAWCRGDSLFNLVTLPHFSPASRDLADSVQEIHAFIGYLILALVGLHAAAALLHHYFWKDGVLLRMLRPSD